MKRQVGQAWVRDGNTVCPPAGPCSARCQPSALFLSTQNPGEKGFIHTQQVQRLGAIQGLSAKAKGYFQLKSLASEWTAFCRSRTLQGPLHSVSGQGGEKVDPHFHPHSELFLREEQGEDGPLEAVCRSYFP